MNEEKKIRKSKPYTVIVEKDSGDDVRILGSKREMLAHIQEIGLNEDYLDSDGNLVHVFPGTELNFEFKTSVVTK